MGGECEINNSEILLLPGYCRLYHEEKKCLQALDYITINTTQPSYYYLLYCIDTGFNIRKYGAQQSSVHCQPLRATPFLLCQL